MTRWRGWAVVRERQVYPHIFRTRVDAEIFVSKAGVDGDVVQRCTLTIDPPRKKALEEARR